MKPLSIAKWTGFLVLTSVAAPVMADSKLSVGAGVAKSSSAYADYDDDAKPFPLVSYEGEHFFIGKDGAGAKLWQHDEHSFSVNLGVSQDEWDPSDSDRFPLFDERHRSILGGVAYQYRSKAYGQLGIKWMHDLGGDHHGSLTEIDYGYPIFLSKQLMLIPGASIKYMDSDYANYYYGISEKEAARDTSVSAYDTGSAFKYGVGLTASYRFTPQWKVVAGGSISWLDSDLEDSPMLDDDTETTVFTGVSYSF